MLLILMSTAQRPPPPLPPTPYSRLAAAEEFPEERMLTLLHSISFFPSFHGGLGSLHRSEQQAFVSVNLAQSNVRVSQA